MKKFILFLITLLSLQSVVFAEEIPPRGCGYSITKETNPVYFGYMEDYAKLLKAELEKRNPTPVEKMSLRAKNSYPFNVSPDEYWDEKQQTSNYSPDDDNNGVDDPQYQITKSDIDDISDWNSIAKSLDDENIPLKDMFGF